MPSPRRYNGDPAAAGRGQGRLKGDDRLDEVKGQVTEVTGLLHDALEKSVQRGENLDRLDRRAENLAAESRHFKSASRQVARQMWWKNKRMQLVLGLVALAVLGAIGFILYWELGRKKK